MTNAEIMDRVAQWQNCIAVHPLICNNDSTHQKLYAQEREGTVVLRCEDCDYVQEVIPDIVLTTKFTP